MSKKTAERPDCCGFRRGSVSCSDRGSFPFHARDCRRIELGTTSGFETAATILGGNAAIGYIVIGLLAFVLGICVTILCFRIRQLNNEEERDKQEGNHADGTDQ